MNIKMNAGERLPESKDGRGFGAETVSGLSKGRAFFES
jgi:hypothetical protein